MAVVTDVSDLCRIARFQLLTRIRVAKNFGTLEGRRYLTRTRLLAFCVLFASSPSSEQVAYFFSSDVDFVPELVRDPLSLPQQWGGRGGG